MKRVLLAATSATLILATGVARAAPPAPTGEVAAAAAPRMGAWGFDLAGMDRSVKPGDDFPRYASGAYVSNLRIPPDRTSWTAFTALTELSNDRVRAIIETASATGDGAPEARQIGALYASFMDEKRLEALDASPLAKDLAAISSTTDRDTLAELMGRSLGGFGASTFEAYIWQDSRTPTRYAAYLSQAGLSLPDRGYYLQPGFAGARAAYRAYVARTLAMAGWPDAEKNADAIVALETRIAEASWTKARQRDASATYNPRTWDQLEALAPRFPWRAWARGAGLAGVDEVIVAEPTAFTAIAAIYADTPVTTLQAWLAFRTADQAAPYLSKGFSDAAFEFHGKTMSGQSGQRVRWKRGVGLVGGTMGEAVGKLYVEAYFPPESKTAVEALARDIVAATKARLDRMPWMSVETRARAQAKLATLRLKIGYPDSWRDYSAVRMDPADLYGNVQRINAFNWAHETGKLGRPVDRGEWGISPQTVNAYYNPTLNEIVFTAAMLQPPFFDPQADPAVNYGALGAAIGKQISHAFDDEGSKYDAEGASRDWWRPDDADRYRVQAARLREQYAAFEPLPGLHINGDLTTGENFGDLAGLLTALDAYHLSLEGQSPPEIDGFTGDQRFFLGFAQMWRAKASDSALRAQIASDPHAPPYFRAYGPVRNVDAWYEAFDVTRGDAMYLKPEKRVRIW